MQLKRKGVIEDVGTQSHAVIKQRVQAVTIFMKRAAENKVENQNRKNLKF